MCAPIRAEEGLLGVLCPPGSSTPYRELPEHASIGGYPTAVQLADLDVDPETLDAEGRCLVIEFPAFVLFGVYSPANSNGLRDDFRIGFLTALDTRVRNLTKMGKNVILTGDLNVSRDLIDTAKAEDNMRSEGMTHEQYLSTPNRRIFNQLLHDGQVPGARDEGREQPVLYDLCREYHPTREGMYTHWEQKINARPGNFGSRIDFVLCSIAIKDWFKEADIQEGLMGSDHCPVYAVTHDKLQVRSNLDPTLEHVAMREEETHLLDLMNPQGMFKDGERQRDYNHAKDAPPLSGKLLPEFTNRRSIRDMFNKKSSLTKPSPTPPTSGALNVSPSHGATQSVPVVTSVPDKELTAVADVAPMTSAASTHIPTSAVTGARKSPEKRRAPSASSIVSAKRSKSSLSGHGNSAPSRAKGQQSLKGFFQSSAKATDSSSLQDTTTWPPPPTAVERGPHLDRTQSLLDHDSIEAPPLSTGTQTDPLASQEASREGWTKLFSKKPPPRCEGHAEPCIILTTKKPGVNCGRQFWMCSRPIGPSGQKESSTQWRCGTFIWASDWKS